MLLQPIVSAVADNERLTKLTIIGPAFFSYTEAIAAEFARRGTVVETFDEKCSNRRRAKILFRLGFGTQRRSRQGRYLDRLAAWIIASGADNVLLVGVEVITRRFVEKLTAAGLRVHLYMWDGHANKGRFREYLDLLSSAATFDPHDAGELGLTYIPLFAEPVFDRSAEKDTDLAFCGTMRSPRVGPIARLLALRGRLRLGLKLYYHSRGMFCATGLTRWRDTARLLPLVSSKPVGKAHVAHLFARSRCVLDIPHPGQTGLTMRTFEALMAGARVLTTNQGALSLLPPRLAARVTVVDRIDTIPLILEGAEPLPPLSEQDRYFLSLRRFVDDLLEQVMGHHSFIPWSTNTSSLPSTVLTHDPSVVTVAVS